MLAKDLYRMLPDTVRVGYRGFIVPVPLKTLIVEEEFVSLVEWCFHETTEGLEFMRAWFRDTFAEFAKKGITEASLLAYAMPAPGTPAKAPIPSVPAGVTTVKVTPWYRWEQQQSVLQHDAAFMARYTRAPAQDACAVDRRNGPAPTAGPRPRSWTPRRAGGAAPTRSATGATAGRTCGGCTPPCGAGGEKSSAGLSGQAGGQVLLCYCRTSGVTP